MSEGLQIIALLLVHAIADFIFQTQDMALNKSKSNVWLLKHIFVYTAIFYIVGMLFFIEKPLAVLLFCITTFVCHFITDYFTSRLSSKYYKEQKLYGVHSFWAVICFDQWLHSAQLIICYEYFKTF